jgi:hypothetical protein
MFSKAKLLSEAKLHLALSKIKNNQEIPGLADGILAHRFNRLHSKRQHRFIDAL